MSNLAMIFAALGDETRLAIVDDLKSGEKSAGEVGKPFDMAAPSISRHLQVLRRAGLVEVRRAGNRRYYSLNRDSLGLVEHWLQEHADFWESAAAHLKDLLEDKDD